MKGLIGTPRAPSISRPTGNGRMIPSESEPSSDAANGRPSQDIEAVVSEIEVSSPGNENGKTKWNVWQRKEECWRGGTLPLSSWYI